MKPKDQQDTNLKSEISDFKKRRIVEESTALFFANGYEQTSLELVAERLKVTKPFIYTHFKNKSEILREICFQSMNSTLVLLTTELEREGSASVRLKRALEVIIQSILQAQSGFVIYQREERNLKPEDAKELMHVGNAFESGIRSLIVKGIEEGDFNVPDPLLASRTLTGILSWLAFGYRPGGAHTEMDIIQGTHVLVFKMLT